MLRFFICIPPVMRSIWTFSIVLCIMPPESCTEQYSPAFLQDPFRISGTLQYLRPPVLYQLHRTGKSAGIYSTGIPYSTEQDYPDGKRPDALSMEKHRIPITEKTVSPGHCVGIDLFDLFFSGKCCDKQNERRIRHVEIGNHRIGHPEPIPGINKK